MMFEISEISNELSNDASGFRAQILYSIDYKEFCYWETPNIKEVILNLIILNWIKALFK